MANEFIRPRMRGESEARPVSKVGAEEGKQANLTGASQLPNGAIITFPWDGVELYKQPQAQQEGEEVRNTYYLGAKVNGKDRTIAVGTFLRTDFNGDGHVISPKIENWVRQFDNPYDLGAALLGKTLKVVATERCKSNFGGVERMVTYPVLEFVEA